MIPAFTVAVIGCKGGVGRTTVTANLAAALSQTGERAAAVGLDPRGDLPLHFGGKSSVGGIAQPRATALVLSQRVAAAAAGVLCVPFGRLSMDELRVAEEKVAGDPVWLSERVTALAEGGCPTLLLDTPAQPGPWLEQALAVANTVLVVVAPEPACHATVPATEALVRRVRGPGYQAFTHFLVNRLDATRALARDVVSALRGTLGERVLPMVIPDDEIVREALGRNETVFREATDSQVVAELGELADWLVALRKRTLDSPIRSVDVPARAVVAVAG